jgi:hypothetical protein
MSKKIWSARADLRKKISELENANKELKETQTKRTTDGQQNTLPTSTKKSSISAPTSWRQTRHG